MEIIITIASIFAISGSARLVSKILPFKICPICAGVAGTWAWILAGMLTNQLSVVSYRLLAGILMGGSVVGIAYQLQGRLPEFRSPMLWKLVFIPCGFLLVYGLLNSFWATALLGGVSLVFVAALFFFVPSRHRDRGDQSGKVEKIMKEMEKCC